MADIFRDMTGIPERSVADPAALDAMLRETEAPFVVRGLVRDWPLVQAGLRSADAAPAGIPRSPSNP